MKSPAKINIFLKIIGTRGNYHEICSRFARFDGLCDEIEFVDGSFKELEIFGEFECEKPHNTIYKAYKALQKSKPEIAEFFKTHAVSVKKNIPVGAGLGGGSSNAATFLLMVNETLNLGISKEQLLQIGTTVGADVPFFLSDYECANVSGIGEIIEEFDDEVPKIELLINHMHSDTKLVYSCFRENFFNLADEERCKMLKEMSSKEILQNYSTFELNDLLAPALHLYPELSRFVNEGCFMSGSGSTFFRVQNG